ncbi:MAG: aminomethyl-transferring glycine dehydrogenase subunit GcvPA [Thermoplasmata archaeon YP2-bin.285]|uniref:Aminomethyl-transferring glycine dehydrogenase subunit GcvPA n=1 Tax=Candidatus Sysuiplasma superficiale TaxID=2823368 RepID=A0A8J7YPL9_9ARCH|nr:aminomethyl-transferring glycine dehydrogenase subunit GcvPA [Candidatus Sysuiplasma superficiale]
MNEYDSMLRFIGATSIDDLFEDIPRKFRIGGIDIPDGLSEMETQRLVTDVLGNNRDCSELVSFLGGGVYDTYVPAIVRQVIGRSELYTSYTPYQSELSQGLLQLIFEYQSMLSELTGMDVINASLYDGASAIGEAAVMCARISEGNFFLIPRAMAPWKKSVLKNYVSGVGLGIKEYSFGRGTGEADINEIAGMSKGAAGVYIEMPNFLGQYQTDISDLKEHIGNVPLVAGVNPLSLATVIPPGEYGADIVVGEGQSLGLDMNFGGPFLGILGCRKEHVRKMPGRIVGATVDSEGRRAFCLTLQAREQHIRRSKATSNVCTNQTLLAVAASVYIAAMGQDGLVSASSIIERKRVMMMEKFRKARIGVPFAGPGFNEFVSVTEQETGKVSRHLLKNGIIAGLPIDGMFPELGNAMLWAVSERTEEKDMDRVTRLMEGMK